MTKAVVFDMIFAPSRAEWEYASARNMSRIQVEQLLSSGCEAPEHTLHTISHFSGYSVYLIICLYIVLGIAKNTECPYTVLYWIMTIQ